MPQTPPFRGYLAGADRVVEIAGENECLVALSGVLAPEQGTKAFEAGGAMCDVVALGIKYGVGETAWDHLSAEPQSMAVSKVARKTTGIAAKQVGKYALVKQPIKLLTEGGAVRASAARQRLARQNPQMLRELE